MKKLFSQPEVAFMLGAMIFVLDYIIGMSYFMYADRTHTMLSIINVPYVIAYCIVAGISWNTMQTSLKRLHLIA